MLGISFAFIYMSSQTACHRLIYADSVHTSDTVLTWEMAIIVILSLSWIKEQPLYCVTNFKFISQTGNGVIKEFVYYSIYWL